MAIRWSKRVKGIAKGLLAAVVLTAVGSQIVVAAKAMFARGDRLRFEPLWVLASIAAYLVGLCVSGFFFGRVLKSGPTPVSYAAALRAYLISQLAKYVPGKALVVVVRVGLVVPYGARAVPAGFATFYETLVFMAAGGLLAASVFASGQHSSLPIFVFKGRQLHAPLDLIALAPGLGLFMLTTPWVFPRVARFVTLPFRDAVGDDGRPSVSWRLFLEGLVLSTIAWGFWGLSLTAIAKGISFSGDGPDVGLALWPSGTAAIALGTVSGFVFAAAPGGLGVREWVVGQVLAPNLGENRALITALALRLTWVVAELLAAAVLTPLRPRSAEPVAI